MHIDYQLGLANAGVFGQENRNSVREKSVNSQGTFLGILLCYALWKPCSWSLFISFSYGQLHLLVTDLHSYPHGPYGLLKFGM